MTERLCGPFRYGVGACAPLRISAGQNYLQTHSIVPPSVVWIIEIKKEECANLFLNTFYRK